jgi:4-hydroxybenzoate polyprenyltransferase
MAWLKLFRIAALPSALSNVLIGFLLANETWQPAMSLTWLLLASACLYSAGMVLNDVFDIDVDQKDRSSRPLPSGKVGLKAATTVGFALLIAGPLFASLVSSSSLCVAVILAFAVYLYDGPLKRTAAAPAVMGSCRTLNILLGASIAASIPAVAIWYAIAIGIFVTGFTTLARNEAKENQTLSQLIPGSLVMIAGLGKIIFVAWRFGQVENTDPTYARLLPVGIGFICLPILRRLALALSTTTGAAVQTTVITSLRSLIVLDACMALLVTNGRPICSIVILSLLGLSTILGRLTKLT